MHLLCSLQVNLGQERLHKDETAQSAVCTKMLNGWRLIRVARGNMAERFLPLAPFNKCAERQGTRVKEPEV